MVLMEEAGPGWKHGLHKYEDSQKVAIHMGKHEHGQTVPKLDDYDYDYDSD